MLLVPQSHSFFTGIPLQLAFRAVFHTQCNRWRAELNINTTVHVYNEMSGLYCCKYIIPSTKILCHMQGKMKNLVKSGLQKRMKFLLVKLIIAVFIFKLWTNTLGIIHCASYIVYYVLCIVHYALFIIIIINVH